MHDLIKNKKIAIIGAGPGGLTLARILQMRGADVNMSEICLSTVPTPRKKLLMPES